MTFRFIILAAGKGTRMGAEVPKALVPVGGKPILQHLHESVMASGVDGIPIVVVGHERAQLCAVFNGECEYVVQEKQLGTAHAVQVCQDAVNDADAIIVLYGDHPFVSAEALQRLAKLHEESHGVITMMTTVVPSFDEWENYRGWGRILRDAHGHINAIREYKDAMESEREIKEVNPGLYCFDTKWLWEILDRSRTLTRARNIISLILLSLLLHRGTRSPQQASPLRNLLV